MLKYRNKPTWYGGVKYQSAKEAKYAMDLDWRLKGKEIKDWIRQPRFDFIINGKFAGFYKLDFMITHLDGSTEFIEVKHKQTKTALWAFKWKILHILYPEVKFTLYE